VHNYFTSDRAYLGDSSTASIDGPTVYFTPERASIDDTKKASLVGSKDYFNGRGTRVIDMF